jgi:hypothetical protein
MVMVGWRERIQAESKLFFHSDPAIDEGNHESSTLNYENWRVCSADDSSPKHVVYSSVRGFIMTESGDYEKRGIPDSRQQSKKQK